jgi:hypothetical protein
MVRNGSMTITSPRPWGAVLAAGTLLATAACGDDGGQPDVEARVPDSFEATPAYLGMVVEHGEAVPYRYEGWRSFGGSDPTGEPHYYGEGDGDASSVTVDVDATFAAVDEAFLQAGLAPEEVGGETADAEPGDDLGTMSLIHLGDEQVYVQVPLADWPDELLTPDEQGLRDLVADTDGWAMVDFSQLTGYSYKEHADIFGGDHLTPGLMTTVVASAEDADALGTREIRGETMNGIGASITVGALLVHLLPGRFPEAGVKRQLWVAALLFDSVFGFPGSLAMVTFPWSLTYGLSTISISLDTPETEVKLATTPTPSTSSSTFP